MIRNLVIASFVALLVSCSSTKPVNSTSGKQPAPSPSTQTTKKDIKFLDDISANPELANTIPDAKTEKKDVMTASSSRANTNSTSSSEDISALQTKYGALLETAPEQITNAELFKSVDQWYGTKYRMGGTSKSGIDCSAFVQAVYLTAFGMSIPRTAFEQYRFCNRISATEMREGDLVFFNTTGGVSHVGIYLRNNKFIHASVARGVTVSDLFDPYYLKRFLGVGRIERATSGTH